MSTVGVRASAKSVSLIAAGLVLGLAGSAMALTVTVPPRVQGNPNVPYEAFNGAPTMLMALVEGCNDVSWQVDVNGDGDYLDADEQVRNATGNGYFVPLSLDVQLPAAEGSRLTFPKFRVTGCGDTATAVMPVKITVERLCTGLSANLCNGDQNLSLTRRVYAARTVNRALWWLFRRFRHDVSGDVRRCWSPQSGYTELTTGHTLNAFLRRGHGFGPDRDADPYYRHMTQCGLHFLLSQMSYSAVRFDDVGNQGVDGQGLFLGWGSAYRYSYTSTAWVEPFPQFGNPDYVSPIGPTAGRSFRHIGQDMADALDHCQGANGWWHYSCRGNSTDASTNGWPPEAMRVLHRKFGTETYDWAKNAQRNMLNGHCDSRGCYYSGWKPSLAGNGLVGYGWTENETYDGNNANIRGLLNAAQGYNYTGAGLYYMYATTKGMRAFSPEIRYYPNGVNWNDQFSDFLIPRFNADGSYSNDPSYVNRSGTDGETAIAVQIIQSWLEAVAFARASPELAGPGIDITFDHSWSYIQDPSVEFTRFCWKVSGDAPAAADADNEALWDFCTADQAEQFVHAYDANLDWGEVQRHTATLGVRDSLGRWVFDQDSVEIKLSLINHKPVLVAHPDGREAFYRGYLGTQILFDGRASYDTDADHEVFPGDGETPRGLPDHITSIHFDLNLDGDYDDAGEDGLNGLVTFVPGADVEFREGELFAVPMRVCDDGQWNGECFDGVTREDCSECSFGSAAVEIVVNREPPRIDIGTCDENGQNCDPYVADGFDGVAINLGGTVDPEGVLGLRFQYDVVEGAGRIELAPEYRGNEDNMGPTFDYFPEPDGPRVDRIRARVWDLAGLMSEAIIRVNVPNIAPVIDDFALQFVPQAPVVRDAVIENLGNGWYRLSVDAVANPDYLVGARVDAHDLGNDDMTYQVDVDGNGRFDIDGSNEQPEFGFALVAGGQQYTATLRVTDDADAVTEDLQYAPPANDALLQYFFDLGDDGVVEVAGGAQGHYDFRVPPGTNEVVLSGRVVDSNGNASDWSGRYELGNASPRFESHDVLSTDGFNVTIGYSAVDPDGDQVQYTIDWGDGSEPSELQGAIAQHAYPENVFRAYSIRITASDGRGGQATADLAVEFTAPPENLPPTLEVARVISKNGFEVLLSVSAVDPDEDALTFTLEWGDGVTDRMQGNLAFHDYPADMFRTYNVRVLVEDGRGGSDTAEVEIDFPPPAANRNPNVTEARIINQVGFDVILTASGNDPDGDEVILTIDWGDGSDPEEMGGNLGFHTYPEGRYELYTITVTATDGRDGEGTRQTIVQFEAPPPNQNPEFEFARIIDKAGFNVVVNASAVDPDDEPLVYTVQWGDDSEPTRMQGGVAEHTYAQDVFRAYTITVTATDPRDGSAETVINVNFPAPAENNPPTFEGARVISSEGFDAVLSFEAVDADNDVLTYTINWGDGSQATVVQGNVAEHSFPAGVYRAYDVIITVDDGNEGTAETRVVVDFPEPAPNNAPGIETARVLSKDGFNVVFGASASDPDGDDLTYTVDWGDGSDASRLRGGLAEHSYRRGVYRNYTITVTVDDGRGGSDSREVAVSFPPPAENQAPEFEFVGIVEKQGFDVMLGATAFDADGDNVTVMVDWGDGTPAEQVIDGTIRHDYPAGAFDAYTIRVTATDGSGGQAVRDLPVAFPPPGENTPPFFEGAEVLSVDGSTVLISADAVDPDGDPVRYLVEWGDGSPAGEMVGGLSQHTYPVGVYGDHTITITAVDGNGGETTVELEVHIRRPGDNADPVIEEADVLPQQGFEVVALVHATDADGDDLTYTFNWGDGTEPVRVGEGMAVHGYPVNIYRSYTVTITVDDGFGGRAVIERQIDFPEPAVNAPPVIDGIDIAYGVRGEITLTVSATDPEGTLLTYAVQWGDELDAQAWANLIGGAGVHRYDWHGGPIRGWLRVVDQQGNETLDWFEVRIVDAETLVHDVRVNVLRGRTVQVATVASDADGELLYAFDFDGDGVYETDDQIGSGAVHTYAEDGEYTIGVRITDPWSGAIVERSVAVRVDIGGELPGDANAPIIADVRVERGTGGEITVLIEANDADGGPLAYAVEWGDGGQPEQLDGPWGDHTYGAPNADGYAGWVEVTDAEGNSTRREMDFVIEDQATLIGGIDVQVIGEGRYLVTVHASDADGDDRLRYSFDFNGDGNNEIGGAEANSGAFTYIRPGRFLVHVQVTDSWSGAVVERDVVVEYSNQGGANAAPIIDGVVVRVGPQGETHVVVDASDTDGDDLTLALHWGDEANDAVLWPGEGLLGRHRYDWPANGQPYAGYVLVSDPSGATARAEFTAEIIDHPTVAEIVITHVAGAEMLLDVRAHDADGIDRLVYAFDFDGDGQWDTVDRPTTAATYDYGRAGTWTAMVRVTDTWSGVSTVVSAELTVVPWRTDNAAPVIHDISVDVGLRGHVTLVVVASDPDGGPLDLVVHWGDEANIDTIGPMGGEIAEHNYPWGESGAWDGYVLVTDGDGVTVRGEFSADLVDQLTVIRDVSLERVRDGVVMVTVLASDADGDGQLVYSFDFDNDGVWDIEGQVAPNSLHEFPASGAHTVHVGVTDTWSGATVEGDGDIDLPDWVPDLLPPQIHEVDVAVHAGGRVVLTVEASDPEGGFLDVQAHWGDEVEADAQQALVNFAGEHIYPWPVGGAPFTGTVFVTDPDGLSAEQAFEVNIVDIPTVVRELAVVVVRDGQVRMSVQASDADTADLTYAFDFEHDGVYGDAQAESSAQHTYEAAGEYTIGVRITDPWSGVSTDVEHTFELSPWVDDVPIADDHLEGEEGACLVFRIGAELDSLETKIDPAACEREHNPDEDLWMWNFGDGATARGSEVGHRFLDDGIYEVVIEGGNPERPRRSRIQLLIANAAPQFITQPRVRAVAGEMFRYVVRIEDKGVTDEIRMELTRGPEGMVIGRGADDSEWVLAWDVPADFDQDQVEVELRAFDGHLENGEWSDDGGEAVQNFEVRIDDLVEPILDAGVEADAGDPAGFDAYTGSSCSCDVSDEGPGEGVLLTLLGLLAVGLRRRRRR